MLWFLFMCSVAVSALPSEDLGMKKFPQYELQNNTDYDKEAANLEARTGDNINMGRFNADTNVKYLLFTRKNPNSSQLLQRGNQELLQKSNFNPKNRVAVLIHGFMGSSSDGFNKELVPAFLQGEDINVIVVDWRRGSYWGLNGIRVGKLTASFLDWLNEETGVSPSQYHIVGFSVGGHTAGITARNMQGAVGYVTALDPSSRWLVDEVVSPKDANYVEVIHTNAGVSGWRDPLGHVDFYPNGGTSMPGCFLNVICHHRMSYKYLAESIAEGGFQAVECNNYAEAKSGSCSLAGRLNMGGLTPKTGSTGIYYLRTNRRPPYSQD